MRLGDKIKQLEAINVPELIDTAIIDNEEGIINANRDQLYEYGQIDVNRPSYKEKYAASTIARKRRSAKFPKTEFITLKWSGDFHESFKLLMFKDKIVIQSDDLKWANFLENRFGNALGLTPKSLAVIRDDVKNSFIKLLKDELH